MRLELHRFDVPLPDDVLLGLVIKGQVSPDGQRHTGFLVRAFDDSCWLYHLNSNDDYARKPLSSSYSYLLVPALLPATANAIITFLVMLLNDTNGHIPFSIAWDKDDYFDEAGKLIKTADVDGFTCTTFVLETLKRYGLDMVDRESWPITSDTEEWQTSMLQNLFLPQEQFLAQIKTVGSYARFKPEESLGAAHYFRGEKLHYSVVEPAAKEVLKEMIRLRPVEQ